MKTAALLRDLAAAGAEAVRHRGSHRIFRLPNGLRVTVPVSGSHADASRATVALVRKALAGLPSTHLRTRTLR
jgi:predicted RNA binding protein YcfA (HicA-like mRNA interferase family)